MGAILQLIGGITSVKVIRTCCLTPYLVFLSLIFLPEAQAEGHVAFVIGNATHANAVTLHNCCNDAGHNIASADALMREMPEQKRVSSTLAAQSAETPALPDQPDAEGQRRRDRLADQAAALEANIAISAKQRMTLKRAMTERMMKMQSDRERTEQRIETEKGRQPPVALDAKTVATQTRQKSTSNCKEINARAQIGDISETDRAALRECH